MICERCDQYQTEVDVIREVDAAIDEVVSYVSGDNECSCVEDNLTGERALWLAVAQIIRRLNGEYPIDFFKEN